MAQARLGVQAQVIVRAWAGARSWSNGAAFRGGARISEGSVARPRRIRRPADRFLPNVSPGCYLSAVGIRSRPVAAPDFDFTSIYLINQIRARIKDLS